MEKGQGHSYLQMTFTFLQVALDFQVPDGSNPRVQTPLKCHHRPHPPKFSLVVPLEAMPFCSAFITCLAFITSCLVLKLCMNASYLPS